MSAAPSSLETNRTLCVFLLSIAILSFNLTRVPMMFDEGFYVQAARDFLAGTPTSNPQHPPLAKYLIAGSIRLFGDTPLGWRFASVLAGGLAAAAIFGITGQVSGKPRTATVAWLLTVAGGFWFVMSRIASLSIFDLAFELAGVWFFVHALQSASLKLYALSGILLGLSVASRWSGLIGLVSCVLVAFIERSRLRPAVVFVGTAFATYLVAWIPLFVREHRSLNGIVAANLYVFRYHHYAHVEPHFGEPWWTWIFRLEPKASLAYLMGNPVVGVLGLFAVAALLVHRFSERQKGVSYIFSLLYLGHLGQWVVGVRPQTFYYYYFEAFAMLAPALALAMQSLKWRRIRADVVVTACALLFFAYWYPVWANLPEPFNTLTGAH